MNRAICLFEDESWLNLKPLVYFIPTYELRCGILTLKEKVEKRFPSDKVLIHSRRYIAETILGQLYDNILFDPLFAENWIFINGRVISDELLSDTFTSVNEEFIIKDGDTILAAFLKGENAKNVFLNSSEYPDFNRLSNIPVKNVQLKNIQYPWDLIKFNGQEILNDFSLLSKEGENCMKNYEGVIFRNRKDIFLGTGCEIEPFVFINAEKGPVYIGNNVKIFSHSSIEGPAYIGNNSMIKTNSSIYHNTSIGPVSKVGGEVENTIIHSYSNKQHTGFLGHSYLGQWINLGAGTTNSDLKNNYSSVRVLTQNREHDTGMTFFGALIGDYTKTAIGTRINTGSYLGACSNLFSDGFLPKYIPSFTWLNNLEFAEYALDKIIETTKMVYSRRGIIFTDNDRQLFQKVFEFTRPERNY